MALHHILVDENVEQRRFQHRNADRNLSFSSIVRRYQNAHGSPTLVQLAEEAVRNRNTRPTVSHVSEHIVPVFNDFSADDHLAMVAWIVMMAASYVLCELERRGETE